MKLDLESLRLSYYAMSDEIRLKILHLLTKYDELCVCQIQPVFKISQPNLSFHLRILRDANLVKTEKKGKWVFYSLNLNNPILKANYDFIKSIKIKENIKEVCKIDI
jgi:ArsR family transcriptional regulator